MYNTPFWICRFVSTIPLFSSQVIEGISPIRASEQAPLHLHSMSAHKTRHEDKANVL